MSWFSKNKATAIVQPKPKVITEIEQAILDRDGQWVRVDIHMAKTTTWMSWTYWDSQDNPVDRQALSKALHTMAVGLLKKARQDD